MPRGWDASAPPAMNPFASMLAAGMTLALGSDSPVTPFAPWEAVRAAVFHHSDDQRISARSAFLAHTRGGWRAAGFDDRGYLDLGLPATFAVWQVGDLVVQAPDDRIQTWSTDPRSGTPGLPDLSPGAPAPDHPAHRRPWRDDLRRRRPGLTSARQAGGSCGAAGLPAVRSRRATANLAECLHA